MVFTDPADYDKVQADDRIAIQGLADLKPGKTLQVVISHSDGSEDSIEVSHSLSKLQIEWFKAGSALNRISAQNQ